MFPWQTQTQLFDAVDRNIVAPFLVTEAGRAFSEEVGSLAGAPRGLLDAAGAEAARHTLTAQMTRAYRDLQVWYSSEERRAQALAEALVVRHGDKPYYTEIRRPEWPGTSMPFGRT